MLSRRHISFVMGATIRGTKGAYFMVMLSGDVSSYLPALSRLYERSIAVRVFASGYPAGLSSEGQVFHWKWIVAGARAQFRLPIAPYVINGE